MSLTVTHAKVSGAGPAADSSKVGGDDWDAGHVITGLTPGVDFPTSATVTLSSAQILDLHNTPVTVVAAPGAGKIILMHRVFCQYTFGTAAYVNGDGAPRLTLDGGAVSLTLSGLIDQTNDYRKSFPAPDFDTSSDPSNAALMVDDGGAAHTTGDGTLTIDVEYTIVDAA